MKTLFDGIKTKKLFSLALLLVGFWTAGVLIHELGHLAASELLGGTDNMIYYAFWIWPHGRWLCQIMPEHAWIASLAGGLVAALFLFIFFWLPARINGKHSLEIAVSYPMLFNFFYAPNELIYYYESFVLGQETLVLFPWAVRHAVIMSGIVFLLLYAKKTIKWLKV